MKVINFFGGPGIGKSTIAADLFVHLKKKQHEVELITEYAKMLVYEDRHNILQDQLYVLAKQNRKLLRLIPKGIEFAVCDSPILMGIIYYRHNCGKPSDNLVSLIAETFGLYNNTNFLLCRDPDLQYKSIGRIQQTVDQAIAIDKEIRNLLFEFSVPFIPIDVRDYCCADLETYYY